MTQYISCPNCGHVLEVDELSEKYEKIISTLTCGKLTDKGSISIDVIGADNTTYQVKYATANKKKQLAWYGGLNHVNPDFCALFAISKFDDVLFLIPFDVVLRRHCIASVGHHGENTWVLNASMRYSNWIWDYRVSQENFMRRVAELKTTQQIAMSFTAGYGD